MASTRELEEGMFVELLPEGVESLKEVMREMAIWVPDNIEREFLDVVVKENQANVYEEMVMVTNNLFIILIVIEYFLRIHP